MLKSGVLAWMGTIEKPLDRVSECSSILAFPEEGVALCAVLQDLDILGTTRPDVALCLWSVKAEIRNECMRLLRRQLTTRPS